MITAGSSRRVSVSAGLVATLLIVLWQPVSAHRRDEYLQAARIAVDPSRLELQLDLTPGIAIADAVLSEIDRDGSGAVDAREASNYAALVQREITVEVDGRPVAMRLVEQRFPSIVAMVRGEGAIQLRFAAELPHLSGGIHRVFYRSDHRPDKAAYLANALAPADTRVALISQRRDADQREITIQYTLAGDRQPPLSWWLVAGLAGITAMVSETRWRRRRRPGEAVIS